MAKHDAGAAQMDQEQEERRQRWTRYRNVLVNCLKGRCWDDRTSHYHSADNIAMPLVYSLLDQNKHNVEAAGLIGYQ